MASLKHSKLSDRFMCVFFDTECTQDLEKCDGFFKHVPNLICAQQMCSKCEAVEDLSVDCEQCGKRTHMFWQDTVGECINYLRLSRPFAEKISYFTQLSWIRRIVNAAKVSGTEMGASIDNGRYQNSYHVCGESALFGFLKFHAYELKEHAQII